MKLSSLFFGMAVGALLLAGCAGLGALAQNPLTEVTVETVDAADIDLIIAPLEGAANDPAACTMSSNGFGCRRDLGSDYTTFDFRTNSVASTSPFYVYARNTSTASVRIQLFVEMDGQVKLDRGYTIPANTTVRIASIRRQSADGV